MTALLTLRTVTDVFCDIRNNHAGMAAFGAVAVVTTGICTWLIWCDYQEASK